MAGTRGRGPLRVRLGRTQTEHIESASAPNSGHEADIRRGRVCAMNRHACLSGDGNQQEWEDLDALAVADDAAVQMIDTSIVRVHQHGACLARNHERRPQSVPLVR